MKECELIKGGHTFGLLAEIIPVRPHTIQSNIVELLSNNYINRSKFQW